MHTLPGRQNRDIECIITAEKVFNISKPYFSELLFKESCRPRKVVLFASRPLHSLTCIITKISTICLGKKKKKVIHKMDKKSASMELKAFNETMGVVWHLEYMPTSTILIEGGKT